MRRAPRRGRLDGIHEVRLGHADDGIGPALESQLRSHGRWLAAKDRLPQRVADHDDGRMTGSSFLDREEASERRSGAERVEEVMGHRGGAASGGSPRAVVDRDLPSLPGRNRGKCGGAVPHLHEVGVRNVSNFLAVQGATNMHELVRRFVRERSQKHGVDDAEHRGRRSDAESQSGDGDHRNKGLRAESTNGVHEITSQISEHVDSLGPLDATRSSFVTSKPELEHATRDDGPKKVRIEPNARPPWAEPRSSVMKIFLAEISEDGLSVSRMKSAPEQARYAGRCHDLLSFRRRSTPAVSAASISWDRLTASRPAGFKM